MIAYLEGRVALKTPNSVILDVGGIGFEIGCGMNTLTRLPPQGETVRIWTVMNVREDATELYGFLTPEEKQMYRRLTSVSGIGPKTALQILSSLPLNELTLAIMTGDTSALARAQGIGKKTAQRIALELREKVTDEEFSAIVPGGAAPAAQPVTDAAGEAVEGLVSLGYTSQEATRAVRAVQDQSSDPAELIMLALRGMSGR